MRIEADRARIERLFAALADCARSSGDVYVTGGGTAVLLGWRASTIDVDLKFDPEPAGVFEAIPRLKDTLEVNIELAAPDDFIPALAGWRHRSLLIDHRGPLRFLHYDLRAQALAKIERAHEVDLADVRAMLDRSLVTPAEVAAGFAEIAPRLGRYPAIDADAFGARVAAFTGAAR